MDNMCFINGCDIYIGDDKSKLRLQLGFIFLENPPEYQRVEIGTIEDVSVLPSL